MNEQQNIQDVMEETKDLLLLGADSLAKATLYNYCESAELGSHPRVDSQPVYSVDTFAALVDTLDKLSRVRNSKGLSTFHRYLVHNQSLLSKSSDG
jgi:hypothetical protein